MIEAIGSSRTRIAPPDRGIARNFASVDGAWSAGFLVQSVNAPSDKRFDGIEALSRQWISWPVRPTRMVIELFHGDERGRRARKPRQRSSGYRYDAEARCWSAPVKLVNGIFSVIRHSRHCNETVYVDRKSALREWQLSSPDVSEPVSRLATNLWRSEIPFGQTPDVCYRPDLPFDRFRVNGRSVPMTVDRYAATVWCTKGRF